MKKIVLIMLSLGAVYTVQADAVKDSAAQRANLDKELQLFSPGITYSPLFAWSIYTASGCVIGSHYDKGFMGAVLGFLAGQMLLSIELGYYCYLDVCKLDILRKLYESDRKAIGMAKN